MPNDAYTEMKLLRMAYRLLVATNQLDDVADAVIAEQTIHVLLYGTRQSEEDETPPESHTAANQDDRVPFDLDEETLRAHIHGSPAAVHIPGYAKTSFPLTKSRGFTIPERVAQLGYHCTPSEAAVYGPALIKLAREAWRQQFAGEPAHADEGDWYGIEDAWWIDPLIHASMAKWRTVTQPGEDA